MDPETFKSEVLFGLHSKSADDIADMLHARGIRGPKFQADSCPIAIWLREATGAQWSSADGAELQYGDANPTPGTGRVAVDTPDSVVDFLELFDSGRYPHLEA